MQFQPKPIDTSAALLTKDILELTERLAENVHNAWAQRRLSEGWRYGPRRDDARKEHPCLVPYEQLPEIEKEYDRTTVLQTLQAVIALGYRIEKV